MTDLTKFMLKDSAVPILCIIVFFVLGIVVGKMIEEEAKSEVCKEQNQISFSLESPGMCRVEKGGKAWLLVDITEEFPQMETLQENNNN